MESSHAHGSTLVFFLGTVDGFPPSREHENTLSGKKAENSKDQGFPHAWRALQRSTFVAAE